MGGPRSGTSLLSRMLNSHERMCVPYEAHIYNTFWKFRDRYEPMTDPANQRRLVENILSMRVFRDWHQPPAADVVAAHIQRPSFHGIFEAVMRACGDPNRDGRWITDDIIQAYVRLFDLGWAHSVEVYDDDGILVGGLYGVQIGGLFAGEAMFHHATDASKVALVGLVDWLREIDVVLLDVQWATPHLASLGVIEIPRTDYLRALAVATSGVNIDGQIRIEKD